MRGDEVMRRHALWIARAMARTDLAPLREEDVEALSGICDVRRVEAGTVLTKAGAEVAEVFIVRDGELHLSTRRRGGGRQPVTRIRPGGVVADIPMFCELPMPLDVVAGTDATVIALPTEQLMPLLQRSPRLSLRWTMSVVKRLEANQRRILTLLSDDLDTQLATVLLDESERDAEHGWVVPLSHGTLAGMLGVRRQSVSRAMRRLRDAGLVASGYRTVVLTDVHGLAAIAGQDPPAEAMPAG